ncbi:hypothetical protein FANTH_11694 [Fusarium anthophilum]|uniref:Uncharacterized protein n=1 Tax=Fusarium anthophilum TaxID=48485 RepID=A0A8H4YWY9_9HYPO|nr:hypothetical protein FANTH_11694 [Fusarium anthophilum]
MGCDYNPRILYFQALWGSFQLPDYKASGGRHSFVDESTSVGILAQSVQDVLLDPIGFERRSRESAVEMTISLARNRSILDKDQLSSDTATRATAFMEASRGSGLLRYVMNRCVTPKDIDDLFAGTPFLTADWGTYIALEQFWFADMAGAELFVENETVKRALRSLPESFDLDGSLHFVGHENRVVERDTSF